MKHMGTKILLVLSGLVAMIVGGALLFVPVAFEASAGITVEPSVGLLSELRAPGGAMMMGGAIIAAGAFVPTLTAVSIWASTLLYLAFGLSRFLGFAIDGTPSVMMLGVAVFEVAIGLACGVAALASRSRGVLAVAASSTT